MLLAAVVLGAVALEGLVTPLVLLALIFAVGTGQALDVSDVANAAARTGAPCRPSAGHLTRCGQSEPRSCGWSGVGRRHPCRHQRRNRLPGQRVHVPRGHRSVAVVAQHAYRTGPPAKHVGEAIRAGGRYVMASPGAPGHSSARGFPHSLRQRHLGAAASCCAELSCTSGREGTDCCWARSGSAPLAVRRFSRPPQCSTDPRRQPVHRVPGAGGSRPGPRVRPRHRRGGPVSGYRRRGVDIGALDPQLALSARLCRNGSKPVVWPTTS